jgi:hypothetical protein
MRVRSTAAGAAALLLATAHAFAQAPFPPQQPQQPAPQQPGQPGFGGTFNTSFGPPVYAPPPAAKKRTNLEIGYLYATSVTYGVGLGVWLGAELGIEDPGVFMIPPAILGVAAPVGVYFLDQPLMPRGTPAAIATGMLVGAGEGLGFAGLQMVTADEQNAWGFRNLSRSMALGSTLGAIGGYAVGYYQEPSPKSSLLVGSGVVWGTAIGSMFGYGGSAEGLEYGRANDSAALGGLIGFNVALVATGALSMVYIPSWRALNWMWIGAGVGAAVSLPVYLFYAKDDGPPAKRGLLFSGTATTLGILAGAVFAGFGDSDSASTDRRPGFARIETIAPMPVPGGFGVGLTGSID